MTETKPSLDEHDDWCERIEVDIGVGVQVSPCYCGYRAMERELTYLREELKRIHEAEMPEPVAVRRRNALGNEWLYADYRKTDEPLLGYEKVYGPELLAYAQRNDAEAREQRERADYNGAEWAKSAEAIVVLQKEKAALIAENEGLRKDAERYRWLRAPIGGREITSANLIINNADTYLDAAIDNAMKGGGE